MTNSVSPQDAMTIQARAEQHALVERAEQLLKNIAPGKWRVDASFALPAVIAPCFEKEATCVAVLYGGDGGQLLARIPHTAEPVDSDALANAAFIAAAPQLVRDLLTALTRLQPSKTPDQGNTFVFCGHVDRQRGGCLRGAGHNGEHVHLQSKHCRYDTTNGPVVTSEAQPSKTTAQEKSISGAEDNRSATEPQAAPDHWGQE